MRASSPQGGNDMTIHTISHQASLDSIWEELAFTEARLQHDTNAADLAPQTGALIERTESIRNGQYAVWRAEIVAQAGVAAADDNLDDTVEAVDVALLHIEGRDRSSARYKRYFPKAPSTIIRLGLESELKTTRTWPESLSTEPEKDLRKLGERLGTIVKDGDAALGARRTSVASTADHRVREIVTLIDDVNNARLSMYGILVQRAVDLGLPKDWPNRFFRRTQREPRKGPPVAPPVPLT
jgi:hypothetical protein